MGAASAALATTMGLDCQQLVMLSSPSTLANRARAFAFKHRLSPGCREVFFRMVEESHAYKGLELNLCNIIKASKAEVFLIHDRDDRHVPWTHMSHLQSYVPHARHWLTTGLGHRKIIRSVEVHLVVADYVARNRTDEFYDQSRAVPAI